jgi:hypothetical protein
MENYLYFAENFVQTGGKDNTRDEAVMVKASSFLGADPISTVLTALYFEDPIRDQGDRIKILLKHATTANGGGFKNVVKALTAAMNGNAPTNGGFVVFADEEADNATITGAATKSVEYDPAYNQCSPDSGTLTAGGGSVIISNDAPSGSFGGFVQNQSGDGVESTDLGLPLYARWIENDTIITEIRFSLEGLKGSGTANDVIGVDSDPAYLYQYKVGTHGVLFKQELICLETPTGGGGTDINIVYAASGTLAEDGAGGTTFGVNGAGIAAGGTTVNVAAATPTTNHYAYITDGDGNTDDSAFGAGQYIYRTYGSAPLV